MIFNKYSLKYKYHLWAKLKDKSRSKPALQSNISSFKTNNRISSAEIKN